MKQVLGEAFKRNLNIMYEKSGSGYGSLVKASEKRRAPMSRDFCNTNEDLLGKILYEDGKPVAIDESSLKQYSIPMHYKIVVVFPVLRKEEIVKRAERRAIEMFVQRKRQEVSGGIDDAYRKILEDYAISLLKDVGGDIDTRSLVDTAIHLEKEKFGFETGMDYSVAIDTLLTDLEQGKEDIFFPLYRMVAPQMIYETIESAFSYSIDYFLKQYLQIGRVSQIIYINNEEKK
jgi:hypothetical protein